MKKAYMLNLDQELHLDFKRYCVEKQISMSEIIEILMRVHLERNKYGVKPRSIKQKVPRARGNSAKR
jgi:hypothetical protein